MSALFSFGGIMRLKQQYQELLRLKKEIDQRLNTGTDFWSIKELMLYLANDPVYPKLKSKENQLIMLESFLNIWLKEKKRLPDLRIETDIFYHVSSLDDVERKYQKIKYCALRVENNVPDKYLEEAFEWIKADHVSGIAIGNIVNSETEKREENFLSIVQYLKCKGNPFDALLLIQYANDIFPGQEKLLVEEADIWLAGQQLDKALETLAKIESPSQEIEELIIELRQVKENG